MASSSESCKSSDRREMTQETVVPVAAPVVVPSITICHDRSPFPLKTAKQWQRALECMGERVNRTIERLSGKAKCRGSALLIYPVMDAAATLDACEWAEATFGKLHEFRNIAERLAGDDQEADACLVGLKVMDSRLKKAVEEARFRVRMSRL